MPEARCPVCGALNYACQPPPTPGMGLTIRKVQKDMPQWVSERRLWLTADGEVVEDGDPRARSLLVGAGGALSAEDADRYGLRTPAVVTTDAAPVPAKAQPKAANKERPKSEDKAL